MFISTGIQLTAKTSISPDLVAGDLAADKMHPLVVSRLAAPLPSAEWAARLRVDLFWVLSVSTVLLVGV